MKEKKIRAVNVNARQFLKDRGSTRVPTVKEFRDMVSWLLETNSGNIATWIDKIANGDSSKGIRADPGRALGLLLEMAEFAAPKLSRTEHVGDGGGAIQVETAERPRLSKDEWLLAHGLAVPEVATIPFVEVVEKVDPLPVKPVKPKKDFSESRIGRLLERVADNKMARVAVVKARIPKEKYYTFPEQGKKHEIPEKS